MAFPTEAFTGIVHPEIRAYLAGVGGPEDPLLDTLEAHAEHHRFPLIGRASGAWLELLTRMIAGRRVFEFGSGFGYSAFFFARAVGDGGLVIGADKDAHEIANHRALFAGHTLASRIDIREGWAEEVFDATEGMFDVVLLDCDKAGYVAALNKALPRVRVGGLILADNSLWGGRVAREPDSESTSALIAFNQYAHSHPRLSTRILPAGDGLSVSLKLA